MLVVKGVMLQLFGILIGIAMLLFIFGAVTGNSGNWIVVAILFVGWLAIREAYRRLK